MEANGRAEEVDAMTTVELNAYLETIAENLDLKGMHEAAEYVRSKKI